MPMFAQHHYVVIARKLKACVDTIYNNECKASWLVEQLADMFATEDPRFNRAKFLAAIYNPAEIKAWYIK